MRMTRLVVLPDFQGLGLGVEILDFMGGICCANGFKFYIKTVNPRMGYHLEHSDKWKPTPHNGKLRKEREEVKTFGKYKCLLVRPSYCYQYIGQGIAGYDDLMQKVDKMRYNKSMEGQLMLF